MLQYVFLGHQMHYVLVLHRRNTVSFISAQQLVFVGFDFVVVI